MFFNKKISSDIGISLPLKTKIEKSFFSTVESYDKEISQNIKNIILTNKGERISDPHFGVGFFSYLFEPMDFNLENNLKVEIINQIKRYAPYVIVNSIDFNTNNEGDLLHVVLKYYIPNLDVVSELIIEG